MEPAVVTYTPHQQMVHTDGELSAAVWVYHTPWLEASVLQEAGVVPEEAVAAGYMVYVDEQAALVRSPPL